MTEESKKAKPNDRRIVIDDEGNFYDQDGNLLNSDEGYYAYQVLERGDRGAVFDFWQRIANGERGVEIDEFIRLVAVQLIEADRSKGSTRRNEIVKAVGLTGQGHVDAVLNTWKRRSTKERDDRIADLILLKLPEREIWRKLAEEGLYEHAPAEGSRQRVPQALRKAIFSVRKAQDARHRELVRGLENLDEKS